MPILNFFGQPVKENEQQKKEEDENMSVVENNEKTVEEKSKEVEEEVNDEEWIDASAADDDKTQTVVDNIADNKDREQEKQEKNEEQEQATTTTSAHEPQSQQQQQQQQQTPQLENLNQEEEQQQQQQQSPPFRLHPIQLGVLVGLLLTRHYKIFSFATLLIFHPLVVQTIKSCFEGHEETLEKAKRAICNVAEKMKQKYDLMKVACASLKGDDNHIREGDNDDTQRRRSELKKRRRFVLKIIVIVLVVFVIVVGNCFLVVLTRERNALQAELQQLKTSPRAIEKELIRCKLENQHLLESNSHLAHEKSECQSGLRRFQRDLEEEKKTHKQEVDKIRGEMNMIESKKQKHDKENEEQSMNSEQGKKENNEKNQQQQTQSSSSSNSNSNNCGPYKRRCGESFKEKLMKRRQEAKKQRDMKMNNNDNNNNNKNKKRKFQPLTALGEFLNPFFEWQLDFEL